MAAYAALVSLLNNIHQIMNHPTLSASLDNEHIQPLLEKTNYLLDFIEGNNYGGGSKEAQYLERRIASAAHKAEDVIESHIVYRIHAEAREARRQYLLKSAIKCVGSHESHRSKKSLDLRRVNENMDAIMKKANEFKEKSRLREGNLPTNPARLPTNSADAAMVGLDEELNQLLDELTGNQSNRHLISIVGMGGMGKTTLAKNVCENLLVKELFQFRAWATISQNTVQNILLQLLSLGEISDREVDDLGLQLHKTLSGRRYLIVIDDIWVVESWNKVKRFFPDNKNASRVLITTRLSNVAKDCGSSLFTMNLLNEAHSWKLFCEKAFQHEDCPRELQEVGKEIVRLCKGLALSIVVIGGLLLKSPKTIGYWRSVANNLKSISHSTGKQESLDVLSLSYNHLPPHLKPCFLYMGVFKEDSEIRVSKIIKLWVAEGFIKPTDYQVREEIAEGYIKDLIDRNLILIGRRRKNGKVGSCSIHDLLRDLCIKLAEQEGFFHLSKGGIQGMERRLLDDWDVEWTDVELPLTRSIMTENRCKPFVRYRLLRVLDELHTSLEVNYYLNVNLRYLAYRMSSVKSPWKLPTSVSLPWNFQTLIIRGDFRGPIVMPTEIWKVRQLRHVECRMMYIPVPPHSKGQDELLTLENLQILKTAVNLRLCEEVCKFIPNIKKLHLLYDHEVKGYKDSLIDCLCNLDRLHTLETLELSILVSTLLLWNREFQKKLTTLFPRSLKKLSLRFYQLEWDDMAIIGSFPQLEVLELLNLHNGGGQWSLVDEQFLRLKFLKIEKCDLVTWDADASHFPVLEKLHLVDIHNLEEIPLGIGDIPTLELIHVDDCRNSAAISAIKIKEEQLDNDNQLQVQVMVLQEHRESFNQMLETEGLTIDHIQLDTSTRYKRGNRNIFL